jgi:hypothetical protein
MTVNVHTINADRTLIIYLLPPTLTNTTQTGSSTACETKGGSQLKQFSVTKITSSVLR